jgi:hypothetical protein
MVPEHRQHAAHAVFPDVALVPEAQVERVQLGDRRAFAEAEVDATIGDEIQCGDLLRYPRRVVGGDLDDAVTEPDVLGALARGTEKHLGRRGMRIFLQEVMLHFPGVVEAERVSELDLVEGLLEELVLAVFVPVPGQLMLVENAEFHAVIPRFDAGIRLLGDSRIGPWKLQMRDGCLKSATGLKHNLQNGLRFPPFLCSNRSAFSETGELG